MVVPSSPVTPTYPNWLGYDYGDSLRWGDNVFSRIPVMPRYYEFKIQTVSNDFGMTAFSTMWRRHYEIFQECKQQSEKFKVKVALEVVKGG